MKLMKIIQALPVIERMNNSQMPAPSAYAVSRLAGAVYAIRDQYAAKIAMLLDVYHGSVSNGGELIFPTRNDAFKFKDELNKIQDADIDTALPVVRIQLGGIANLQMRPVDFSAISDFIEFIE